MRLAFTVLALIARGSAGFHYPVQPCAQRRWTPTVLARRLPLNRAATAVGASPSSGTAHLHNVLGTKTRLEGSGPYRIPRETGEHSKFIIGTVKPADIAAALARQCPGLQEIQESAVLSGFIDKVGFHAVEVDVGGGVLATVEVEVTPLGANGGGSVGRVPPPETPSPQPAQAAALAASLNEDSFYNHEDSDRPSAAAPARAMAEGFAAPVAPIAAQGAPAPGGPRAARAVPREARMLAAQAAPPRAAVPSAAAATLASARADVRTACERGDWALAWDALQAARAVATRGSGGSSGEGVAVYISFLYARVLRCLVDAGPAVSVSATETGAEATSTTMTTTTTTTTTTTMPMAAAAAAAATVAGMSASEGERCQRLVDLVALMEADGMDPPAEAYGQAVAAAAARAADPNTERAEREGLLEVSVSSGAAGLSETGSRRRSRDGN